MEGSGFRGGLVTAAAAVAQSLDQYREPSVARLAVIGSPNTTVPDHRNRTMFGPQPTHTHTLTNAHRNTCSETHTQS